MVVDIKAKEALQEYINNLCDNQQASFHPDSLCPITIKDNDQTVEIVSNLKKSLTLYLASRDAIAYQKNKGKISPDTSAKELEAWKYANKNTTSNLHCWLVK